MKRALNYNEKKVQQGKAEMIHAGNVLQLPEEMSFHNKLERLEKQMELNHRAEGTKVIHISINFPPEDLPKLDHDNIKNMVDDYMKKMGFGDQPYYVYQHHDSGHPHVHVLSTTIRSDGTRIPTHNLGKDISKPTTEELEKKYGLTKADNGQGQKQHEQILKIDPQKIEAGKVETKRAITNVLDHVIDHYKYTSLPELNSILRNYNLKADRGQPGSRIYNNRGLTYTVLNENGEPATKPIKASAIYSKPTLDKIEEKGKQNELNRDKEQRQLKTAIVWAMQKNPKSLEELAKALQKEGITVQVSRSKDGRIFGMTYVDHQNKSVFKGSDLGKEYSAKGMQDRMRIQEKGIEQPAKTKEQQKTFPEQKEKDVAQKEEESKSFMPKIELPHLGKLIEEIIQPGSGSSANNELTHEEKRKRRRQNELEND